MVPRAVMRIPRFLWVSCSILAFVSVSCGDDDPASAPPDDPGGDAGSTGGISASGGRPSTGGQSAGGFVPSGGGSSSGGIMPSGGRQSTGGTPNTGGAQPVTGGRGNCDGQGFCPTPELPPPPGNAKCGGVECPANQECCLLNMQCFDPFGSRASCLIAPGTDPQGRKICAANSDCAEGQYCNVPADGICGGPGFCASREMCPQDAVPGEYCGCDGRTYTSRQQACSVGARTPYKGACGVQTVIGRGGTSAGLPVTPCGTDADCPEKCCAITGTCYKAADAALCALPPAGTSRPCLSNLDCLRGAEYCDANTCEGPGGCKPLGDCTDALLPVCGCDGHTYENAGCAAKVGMRVTGPGACGDGGI